MFSHVALFLQFLCTMLIFLDSGLYFPRPSNPTPRNAAPSIWFFWYKQIIGQFIVNPFLIVQFCLKNSDKL